MVDDVHTEGTLQDLGAFVAGFLLQESVVDCGPGSSGGIATDCPGSNPGGDEVFRPSRPSMGPTQPLVQWVPGFFPGGRGDRSVWLTPTPI